MNCGRDVRPITTFCNIALAMPKKVRYSLLLLWVRQSNLFHLSFFYRQSFPCDKHNARLNYWISHPFYSLWAELPAGDRRTAPRQRQNLHRQQLNLRLCCIFLGGSWHHNLFSAVQSTPLFQQAQSQNILNAMTFLVGQGINIPQHFKNLAPMGQVDIRI